MAASVTAVAALLASSYSALGVDLKSSASLEQRSVAIVKTAPGVLCDSQYMSGVPCVAILEVGGTHQMLVRIVGKKDEPLSIRISVYPARSIEPSGLPCGPANTFEEWCVVRFKYADGPEIALFADFKGDFKMHSAYSREGVW